jgi:hypothetical protein
LVKENADVEDPPGAEQAWSRSTTFKVLTRPIELAQVPLDGEPFVLRHHRPSRLILQSSQATASE